MKQPVVYILASQKRGTLYIGVTSDLARRIHEHREGSIPGFTARHGVTRLVHMEPCADMPSAIAREKQLKAWRRDWKIALIEEANPVWRTLPSISVSHHSGQSLGRHRRAWILNRVQDDDGARHAPHGRPFALAI